MGRSRVSPGAVGALVVLLMAITVWAAGPFTPVGSMVVSRSAFTLTTLLDGTVLAVGAFPFERRAEIFDPATSLFTFTGSLVQGRRAPAVALLPDGRVLVAGGLDSGFLATSSAEIYSPAARTFSPTAGPMTASRGGHTATLLDDGRVLIVGGYRFNAPNSALASAELFDPTTGRFTATGSMGTARSDHTATRLADGRVLVTGGFNTMPGVGLTAAEIYNPASGTFTGTGSLHGGRGEHTATRLLDGTVMVAGGYPTVPDPAVNTTELFDPGTGTFTTGAVMSVPRGSHTATLGAEGSVLIAGGYMVYPLGGATLSSAERYLPASRTFVAAGTMAQARGRHAAARLDDGSVLGRRFGVRASRPRFGAGSEVGAT